jgi:uncharacterized protein YjbJ (UPF0337 family)
MTVWGDSLGRKVRRPNVAAPLKLKEFAMGWNRIEGNWKHFNGKVKEQWGHLTDDHLEKIAGRRDQLEGKIQNNVMRSFAGATLSGLAVLSMTGAASAGPMSVSSGSAISAASPAHVAQVRYYRRHVHYYRHHRYYRRYGGYDPGPAIAGAALGLLGAAAAGAARSGYDDYYGYPYGYYQPYGYQPYGYGGW